MNKIYLFLLVIVFSCELSVIRAVTPRKVINLNREWKYIRQDVAGAQLLNFDDKEWETIGLPHSFSIPYFMSNDFYQGYGWYRKYFNLTEELNEKRLFVEFDGVFQEAEVYLNGQKVGSHIGGYTGFCMDLTNYAHVGQNLLAVRVNNLWRPDVAPRAGEHTFSGGIYRNVRLVQKESAYIDWYGTFITTPDLQQKKGRQSRVHITTDVWNHSKKARRYTLKTSIIDSKNKIVTTVKSTEYIEAGQSKQFTQLTETLLNPSLWHPNHPHLYKAISFLYDNDLLMDQVETTFGFRWFEWTSDKGFFFNGQHHVLKGVNVHQDQAGWGDAVTETAAVRDVQQMKDAGFDFIRGSHYPHSPAFSNACDKLGMFFWSEAPFWGIGGFRPDGYWNSSAYPVNKKYRDKFESSALQQLEEMIRIHRNHPSILVWSMCNEAFFSAPEVMDGVKGLLVKMVKLSHQLDPSRPAAIGGAQRPLGENRIDKLGDLAGYNGDGATQPDFQNPGIPSIVSEYGSTTSNRPGEYDPGWGCMAKNNTWKGYPWRSGQAIWCGFDHGSIAGSQLGKMGIVDYFRIPKRSWYWYRNEYRQIVPPQWPKLGVPSQIQLKASKSKNILADGTDDVQLSISILDAQGKEISNSPDITLRVVSGPGEFPTGSSIVFKAQSDIPIIEGKAAIAFRSYYAGRTLIEAQSDGMPSSLITLEFIGAPMYIGNGPQGINRPYVRYESNNPNKVLQTFGPNNPIFVSSQKRSHPAAFAGDCNPFTWWEAKTTDEHPICTLDTEKGLDIQFIQLDFPKKDVYQFKIEISDDERHWFTIRNQQNNDKAISKYEINLNNQHVKGRFVRVVFQRTSDISPINLSEFIVKGYVRN